MEVYLLALYVSLEQEEAIQQLFKGKKWLLDKIGMISLLSIKFLLFWAWLFNTNNVVS